MKNRVRAIIVADLGFGDSGKGSTVDRLAYAHSSPLVVKYTGGPQAAHHVYLNSDFGFCFKQLSAGSFNPNCVTYIADTVLVDPFALVKECEDFRKLTKDSTTDKKVIIDENCKAISFFQILVNRFREVARGANAHGSCGQGIGETKNDILYHPESVLEILDYLDKNKLQKKLFLQKEIAMIKINAMKWYPEEYPNIESKDCKEIENFLITAKIIELVDNYYNIGKYLNIASTSIITHIYDKSTRPIIFEGSQGFFLDENHGFFPHVTWANTTMAHAEDLTEFLNLERDEIQKIGVCRPYMTRHGKGPFPTEIAKSAKNENVLNSFSCLEDNATGLLSHDMRYGWCDLTLLNLAMCLTSNDSLDALSITCLDRLLTIKDPLLASTYYNIPHQEGIKTISHASCFEKSEAATILSRIKENINSIIPVYEEFQITDLLKEISKLSNASNELPILIEGHGKERHEAIYNDIRLW